MVNFIIIDLSLPYNIVMGHPMLNQVKAAISTYQMVLQFETDNGAARKVFGDQ